MFWQVGKRINDDILQNKREDYGKQIVLILSTQLKDKYGKNFELGNLRRMLQFAEQFPDLSIVVPLARQLSWSHFTILIPLKNQEAKLFYANLAVEGLLGIRKLRKQISNKTFERTNIANLQNTSAHPAIHNTFKDPHLLYFFRSTKYLYGERLGNDYLK